MAQKTTFFSSGQSSWNFEFAQAVSYQKKIIKNNGERILALSIAVFGGFVIENCKGGNCVYKEIKEKNYNFQSRISQKTAINKQAKTS